jgi:hypothetical protein
MITLILNYITSVTNDTLTITTTTTFCSGLLLPLIYFTNPLPSTITQELKQLTEENNKYNPQIGIITNISKG